jgi:hypothetical protein
MGVGEDEMEFLAIFSDQLITEAPDSGACINDDNIIAFGADFDASGISAVLEACFPGDRNRSSGPPALNYHRLTFFPSIYIFRA